MYGSFAAHYDRLMDDVDYREWAAYLLELIALSVGPGPKRVLDAACGTGNLTIPLAKAGHDLTGADMSEDMLRVASEKARASGRRIPFVRQRLQDLKLHKAADAIVCACDGVNYLTEDADLAAFFASSCAALAPGGALLFDISSRHKIETQLAGQTYGEDRADLAYLWQNHFDGMSNILEMDLTFFVEHPPKSGTFRRFTESHRQRAHDVETLIAALGKAGFADIRVYGFPTLTPPAIGCDRIQFAATKIR